jgi:hypothetical protein
MIKQEILDKLDELENYHDELEDMLESNNFKDKDKIKVKIEKIEDEIEILTDMLDEYL